MITKLLNEHETATTARGREIEAEIVAILQANKGKLQSIISALESVNEIVECTYATDEETGERIDEPGEHSAADIVEMLCGAEISFSEGYNTAVELFAPPERTFVVEDWTGKRVSEQSFTSEADAAAWADEQFPDDESRGEVYIQEITDEE